MADKSKSIKIDKVEIKDHRNVSFTMAFILVLIAFTAGALAYRYFFMILPTKPGCVQVMVKTAGGEPVPHATVEVSAVIVGNVTGEIVASGLTGPGGKVKLCDGFQANNWYSVLITDSTGELLWVGLFSTNERSTADFPVIVRQEY